MAQLGNLIVTGISKFLSNLSVNGSVIASGGFIGNVQGNATSASSADKLASSVNKGNATIPVYIASGIPVACAHSLAASVPAGAQFTDTTYGVATQSANGLLSAPDKKKLDGIASGATAVTSTTVSNWGFKKTDTNTWRGIQDNLTSTSTSDSLTANQGRVLKGLVDGKASTNVSLVFSNIAVKSSSFVSDSTYASFPFKLDITCRGVTSSYIPFVVLPTAQVLSGCFAPLARTDTNKVTIYCSAGGKADFEIPSILCVKSGGA